MFSGYQKIIFATVVALVVFLPAQLFAATLLLKPAQANYSVGSSFAVDVIVSSSDQALNAVSGHLSFPATQLEAVSISKTGSILSYWVKEPTISNGIVDFEGIVPNPGFRGIEGKVLTIIFRAKQTGLATVSFSSGSILANDGAGTNILSDLHSATINIGQAALLPAVPVVPTPPVATKPPVAPVISSPTHPDPDQWYNQKDAEFEWTLPPGVSGVNILANKEPKADPGQSSDGVFKTYTYKNLSDGERYLHVKFKNGAGWGPTSHFKFNIDTVAPENLVANLSARATTTDPKIALQITSTDQLSGLDHYTVQINDSLITNWPLETDNIYDLSLDNVGENKITVTAFDRAGNIASTSVMVLLDIASVITEPVVVPVSVSGWGKLVASLTPELLLAVALIIGLCLLFILIGSILGRNNEGKSGSSREARELMAAMHKILTALIRQKKQQIDVLELAKTRRTLTAEEALLLEQLKRELTDLNGKLE